METVDVQKEVLEEVELLGRTGYFTEMRVDKETVPEGMYCYELRHGDDDGVPVSVEENVRVNYFGAVLLAEVLELGNEKALQFGYEDFGYTGEQMYLSQIMKKEADIHELVGADILPYLSSANTSFKMNEKEAELLSGYMDGHGYVIGYNEGQFYRGDLCAEVDKVVWEETTIDDLVDSAMEWNYELLKEAKADMENSENFSDFADKHSRYEDLCADEKILDAMFDRTKYGEQLEHIAEMLVEQFVQNLQSKGDIDGAVKELAQGIKGGQEVTAAQQPDQKKGRAR